MSFLLRFDSARSRLAQGWSLAAMLIVGISDLGRNPAVAVFDDASASPLAAIEENKLNRRYEDHGVPVRALEFCLSAAGARMQDITAIGIAGRPHRARLREEHMRRGLFPERRPGGRADWSEGTVGRRIGRAHRLRDLVGAHVPTHSFEHHLCHAGGAFYSSGFDRALILTLDGSGDMWSGLIAIGEGSEIRRLRPMAFPNSLGWLYGQVTELLGFRPGIDEHKTQWLSCQGEPAFIDVFRRLFRDDIDELPVIDKTALSIQAGKRLHLSSALSAELQLSPAGNRGLAHSAAVARSVQDFLEERVVALAQAYRRRTGARDLCVSGGVFLNGLLVRALEQRAGFDRVFVQPAPDNPGTALGAAMLLRRRLTGRPMAAPVTNAYLGPEFGATAIKPVLDNCKLIYGYPQTEDQLLAETVRLLLQGKIVAWYQGRMEFGHRALGNRSILASPFAPFVKENLNEFIKHRQGFHPFLLSMPSDVAASYVEASDNCRFVGSIGELRSGIPALESFTVDGRRVRVHLVEASVNPRFAALLRRFGREAAAPILVNASFNLFGEPLVCDPRDAVRSFYCSGLDALVIGDFLLQK